MASINYEHSLNEKILVVYEHDSFDDIQETLLTWCCHQYINCSFKVYFNNYSHELTHIGFVQLSYNDTDTINVIQHFTVDHDELSNQRDAVKFYQYRYRLKYECDFKATVNMYL
ncbi:hypothetical protein C0W96_07125 [Photobacterium kishitanii]|uniref:hypothetical protein n=1 Tax=Photobacterium kishitanii TaxID=318456 RepID=UPI0005D414DA|nr:hypothetical protein [Photobacterium kishitanii]KJG07961.1 hypothetical protein UB40_18770 [Photobacterium kishitanii]PSV07028.1 hypothetical protein C0W96_07125 [Photobacterium kishitanii]PSV77951.1 hypothetical protein C0W29_01110 [Photobacterium kishitanii]